MQLVNAEPYIYMRKTSDSKNIQATHTWETLS